MVTRLFPVEMLGYTDVNTILYEGRKFDGELATLFGVTQVNLSERGRKVPDPKDGIAKMTLEDVELIMGADKPPIVESNLNLSHNGKLLPVTVILSPGARTRGLTFEMICPEQQDRRHIKHNSAGKDARCGTMEQASRRDKAVKYCPQNAGGQFVRCGLL
jgi:hypothetical protein